MIAVDTNVLVRLLTNDDPVQSPAAERLFATNDVFVTKTVLLETAWVLDFSYSLDRATIHGAFQRLLAVPSVTVEGATLMVSALAWFTSGLDFADAIHVASSPQVERFVTFDRALIRRAARAHLAPPVTLTA